jgi:NADH:ubiquinone oxidoreductase subunit E
VTLKVTVCVGSSCHVRGSRAVLNRFAQILESEQLQDDVALLGSFCMERCGETMNWRLDGQDGSSKSVEEAEQTLRDKLHEVVQKA